MNNKFGNKNEEEKLFKSASFIDILKTIS